MASPGRTSKTSRNQAGTEITLDRPEKSGTFGDGFEWRIETSAFGSSDDADAWPLRAIKVTIHVLWRDGRAERSLSMTTLRTLPKTS